MSIRNNRRIYSSVGYVLNFILLNTKPADPHDSKDSSFQSVFNFFINAILVC